MRFKNKYQYIRFICYVVFKFKPEGVRGVFFGFLRFIALMLLVFSYLTLIDYLDEIPKNLDDSRLEEGYIEYAGFKNRRRRGLPYFMMRDGRKYYGTSYKNISKLEYYIGEKVKIWSYPKRDWMLLENSMAIEVELIDSGEKLFFDWHSVRKKIKHVDSPFSFVFMIILSFIFDYIIFSSLKRECLLNKDGNL